MPDELHPRRIDVLAFGLFGLAVGALTLGVARLGGFLTKIESGHWSLPCSSAASCKFSQA